MGQKGRQSPRKPATKFAHLRRKLEQGKLRTSRSKVPGRK
jgi:hypothetical protein